MRIWISSALTCAVLALSACSGTPDQPAASASATPADDTCRASHLQDRIGRTLDVTTLQEIEDAVPTHRVRVLKPDTAVTMDNVPERANVKTDDSNVITSITCG
ncbi:MAG: I78 family peptidase inhibitor [Dongiaceae bacterium]